MSYRIILALAEGPHDVAFIYRILKENGFITTRKTIGSLPSPLNLYLSNPKAFQSASIVDMKIGNAQQSFFPREVLEKGKNTFVLFSSGGVTQSEARKKIISQFNAIKVANDDNAADNEKELSISVLFFLDAEGDGVEYRIRAISQEICEAMTVPVEAVPLVNQGFIQIDDITFGAFVFTKEGSDEGRLEDILIPLMKEANEELFEDATNYLLKVNEYGLFKGKTNNANAKLISRVDGQDFNFEKSLISTAGQLQTSGKSNIQVIRESSYLSNEKIVNSEQCKLIAQFIENSLLR